MLLLDQASDDAVVALKRVSDERAAAAAKVVQLQRKLEDSEASERAAVQRADQLSEANIKLEGQIAQMQLQLLSAQREAAAQKQNVTTLQAQIASISEKFESFRQNTEIEQAHAKDLFDRSTKAADAAQHSLWQQVSAAQAESERLRASMTEMERAYMRQIDALKQDLGRQMAGAQATQDMVANMRKLQQQLDEERAMSNATRTAAKRFEADCIAAQDELVKLRAQLADANQRVRGMHGELEQRCRKLQDQLDTQNLELLRCEGERVCAPLRKRGVY